MKPQDDTIAAIITPIGEGGISVIRLSGTRAIEITEMGFRGKQKLASPRQSDLVRDDRVLKEAFGVLLPLVGESGRPDPGFRHLQDIRQFCRTDFQDRNPSEFFEIGATLRRHVHSEQA